tara:strand:+ start:179 stop:316 length:138 start_codon:yes stop_codon:yes gene_type:complete
MVIMRSRKTSLLLPYQIRFFERKQKIGRYFMAVGFVIGLAIGFIL